MKGFPIHQNLSTSFVNLAALVRHLRDLQFTGSVRVELSSYEAEIIFSPTNRVQAREYDRLAGRISQGEHAFKRILVRSREPFGRIHVLRAEASESAEYIKKAFVDDRISSNARRFAFGRGDHQVIGKVPGIDILSEKKFETAEAIVLATELLLTVSDAFEKAGLDFEAAFQTASEFAAEVHPFMDPIRGDFTFEKEEIVYAGAVRPGELFDGILAALEHIVARLSENDELAKLRRYSKQRIHTHLTSRKRQYDRLSLSGRIWRIFG